MPRTSPPSRMHLVVMLLALLSAALMLTACASGPKPTPAPSPPQAISPVPVPPPPNLTTAPQPLPQPASGRLSDLQANHREVARLYHQLASQMCLLLQFLQAPTDGCPPITNHKKTGPTP